MIYIACRRSKGTGKGIRATRSGFAILARKEKLLLSTLCLFYSRLGEQRNRYARRKVDVIFRDHRVVFDCFVSILQGPVPRKMVEFNPGLSQISSAVSHATRDCTILLSLYNEIR